jgi:predicted small secreted protein
MKIYLVCLVSALFAFSLAGCNTVKGAGQDMQKGGQKVSDTAKENGAS